MNPISCTYVEHGRSRQKSRTHQALVAAARDLVTAGQAPTLLREEVGDDSEARLAVAAAAFTDLIQSTEAQQRTMLRLSLTEGTPPDSLPLRQVRAIGWYTEALQPLVNELGADVVHQIVLAVRSATGIEARV